jgi:hypothetical protein
MGRSNNKPSPGGMKLSELISIIETSPVRCARKSLNMLYEREEGSPGQFRSLTDKEDDTVEGS